MKVMKISQWVLRITVLLALILGLMFWGQPGLPAQNPGLKGIHMLLGILVVLALWAVGLAQIRLKGGSFTLAAVALVVGLAVAIVGFAQEGWKGGAGQGAIETINIIHLLLGLIAVGCGEMIAGRVKRAAKATI